MARPRVFISSTYYDLKHIRASLENFVESLGFDAVLFEKGKVAFAPDVALDESCYREASTADIFTLIIGGRAGSETTRSKAPDKKNFFDRYNSITSEEYRTAVERDIPIYVLIERSVYDEYETYQLNKANESVSYARVDSVNVFELIETVLSQKKNNAMHTFDRYADIEMWLREQWAGLFQELLRRTHGQTQLTSLQKEVGQLSEVSTTLQRYVEQLLTTLVPEDSVRVIERENERLRKSMTERGTRMNPLVRYMGNQTQASPEEIAKVAVGATSVEDFLEKLYRDQEMGKGVVTMLDRAGTRKKMLKDLNDLRDLFGVEPLQDENKTDVQPEQKND